MKRKETCETCRFWDCYDPGDDGYAAGSCRRFPPVRTPEAGAEFHPDGWSHPSTYFNDWCGEWHPHPPQEPADAGSPG